MKIHSTIWHAKKDILRQKLHGTRVFAALESKHFEATIDLGHSSIIEAIGVAFQEDMEKGEAQEVGSIIFFDVDYFILFLANPIVAPHHLKEMMVTEGDKERAHIPGVYVPLPKEGSRQLNIIFRFPETEVEQECAFCTADRRGQAL